MVNVAILAGGKGTRFSEQTVVKPKPMIEIGGRPIIWHILQNFRSHGFADFSIALGYKSEVLKSYFKLLQPATLSATSNSISHRYFGDDYALGNARVNLVDTGQESQTGGRIKRLVPFMGGQTFLLAWGDGLHNINFSEVLEFHRSHGRLGTMVVVNPPARFGHVRMQGDQIVEFQEKPERAEGWINGGVFVLEPDVGHYIAGDDTQFEKEPLERLAREGELMAFKHPGFWQCMDTVHDHKVLQEYWSNGDAPWAVWENLECESSLLAI